MRYGIYYAYWEKEWKADYIPYVQKVKELGFDILEIGCAFLPSMEDEFLLKLKDEAERWSVTLTGGYGPAAEHNIASADPAVVKAAFDNYEKTFQKMKTAGMKKIGGGLYSYWPVDYTAPIDKQGDLERSIAHVRELGDMAADYGITLGMEVLNRFEGYLLNTCEEGLDFVSRVDRPNVKLMLDTFHMNIEEDSFADAIRKAGKWLGHFHVGEANRRPPHAAGRIPWQEIGEALREIGYDGDVVMEPFVRTGGKVGSDIKIWHPMLKEETMERMDADAAASVKFLRDSWG